MTNVFSSGCRVVFQYPHVVRLNMYPYRLQLTHFDSDIGLEIWQMNPFSRGNVTITSTDAIVRPQVNINYFDIEVDL